MPAPAGSVKLVPPWLTGYRRALLGGDLAAGLIVTVLLIPQSLAYAMLAGLPPQMGLYASILPLVAYAALGTSMSLAVGPVAVVSLMTASARTPLAGVISAVLMAGVLAGATGWLRALPHAVLAATIVVAVSSLIVWKALRDTWRYDRLDGIAFGATAAGVLVLGVEQGVVAGVAVSLASLVWRGSRPHIAVVGRVPGTEHYRNVERHKVETLPGLLAVRIDESLFFGNAAAIEEALERLVAAYPGTQRLLLILSAVNHIDATALATLEELERSLERRGIELSLAEVKGPVTDRLARTPLGKRLLPRTFLSTHRAFEAFAAGA